MAPKTAQVTNTFDGENLSDIVNMANKSVPMINPNCTEEMICPNADGGSPNSLITSTITALPANHKEVQKNCAAIIYGKTFFALCSTIFSIN